MSKKKSQSAKGELVGAPSNQLPVEALALYDEWDKPRDEKSFPVLFEWQSWKKDKVDIAMVALSEVLLTHPHPDIVLAYLDKKDRVLAWLFREHLVGRLGTRPEVFDTRHRDLDALLCDLWQNKPRSLADEAGEQFEAEAPAVEESGFAENQNDRYKLIDGFLQSHSDTTIQELVEMLPSLHCDAGLGCSEAGSILSLALASGNTTFINNALLCYLKIVGRDGVLPDRFRILQPSSRRTRKA